MKKLFLPVLVLFTFASCSDDSGDQRQHYYYPEPGVFITNEGNYNSGDGSLSYYDPATGTVENEVFFKANMIPLGDVVQSMTIIDGRGYIVVNNSGKIEVINSDTFRQTGRIKGIASPRKIAKAAAGKLYVTDMGSSNVSVVDPSTLKVTKTIELTYGGNTATDSEDIIIVGTTAYVCCWAGAGNQIYRINTSTDQVTGVITLTDGPNSMVVDKNGKLWVISEGGYDEFWSPGVAALTPVDLGSFTAGTPIEFPDAASQPSKLHISNDGETLYFIVSNYNNYYGATVTPLGVYAMSITATELPAAPLIAQGGGRNFYGLGISPDGEIYVGDASFTSDSHAYIYSATGVLEKTLLTAIGTNGFCFKE